MKTIINSSQRTNHAWFKVSIALFTCLSFLITPSCEKDEFEQNLVDMEGMEFTAFALSPFADLYYGPETFSSVFKQTVVETRNIGTNFTYFEGNLTLKVQNGSSNKTKVSSVKISIDGVVIISSADFRKNVNVVSKQLSSLTPTSVLEVTLEGKKGSFIELLIEGTLKEGVIKDVEGKYYTTVQIGTQTWMAENLKTAKYSNGDLIGTTTPATLDIRSEIEPKYQWAYNGNETYVAAYGRLYTWYAVTDARNVCPTGWYLPTINEWYILTHYLEDNGYAYPGAGYYGAVGKSMAATIGWKLSEIPGNIGNNQNSNNSSGFTAFPGGWRYSGDPAFICFNRMGEIGRWWMASETEQNFNLFYNAGAPVTQSEIDYIHRGYSVRCIKEN
jgi:uncharacterized protein (TIGR02145 family)